MWFDVIVMPAEDGRAARRGEGGKACGPRSASDGAVAACYAGFVGSRVDPPDLPYKVRSAMASRRLHASVRTYIQTHGTVSKVLTILEATPSGPYGSRSTRSVLERQQWWLSGSRRHVRQLNRTVRHSDRGPAQEFLLKLEDAARRSSSRDQMKVLRGAVRDLRQHHDRVLRESTPGRGRPAASLDLELWDAVHRGFTRCWDRVRRARRQRQPVDLGRIFLSEVYAYLLEDAGQPPVGTAERAMVREHAKVLRRRAAPCLKAFQIGKAKAEASTDRGIQAFVRTAKSLLSLGPVEATNYVMAGWHGLHPHTVAKLERKRGPAFDVAEEDIPGLGTVSVVTQVPRPAVR